MLEYPPEFDYGMPMVAFIGPMASGKTTAAQNLFPKYEKLSLAGPLKKTAKEYYGVTGKTNEERQILQELADDLKKWDNDVFTKRLLWEAHNLLHDSHVKYYNEYEGKELPLIEKLPIVVDDLRFKHEADDLKRYGFILVRVFVPDDVRFARIAEKYPDTDPSRFEHKSEKDWKNITPDYTILGDGTEAVTHLREVLEQRYG